MFEEACSLHAFIDGCESSADVAINPNVRQAAGLQWLHELALLKELQAEPWTLLSAAATKTTPRGTAGPLKLSAIT
jgi:hypothetical protein